MYEIELKAHVEDARTVLDALASFARTVGTVEKNDTYYRLPLTGRIAPDGRSYLTCRIRLEKCNDKQRILFTYKRKSLIHESGNDIEVNDEKECSMDSTEALEAMLFDAGFVVSHKKQKTAIGYVADTSMGEAHIELCTVPPLGDFLEIEILSAAHDAETVRLANEAIKGIFAKCAIPLDAIEERYYTQMLEERQ